MFSFLVISDFDRIADCVNQVFATIGLPRNESSGRLLAESPSGMEGGWIAFQPIEDFQYDYEPEELATIKNQIKNDRKKRSEIMKKIDLIEDYVLNNQPRPEQEQISSFNSKDFNVSDRL